MKKHYKRNCCDYSILYEYNGILFFYLHDEDIILKKVAEFDFTHRIYSVIYPFIINKFSS
ncbi:MAG: hypothetical protein LIP08_02685 [Bacteroides sp.]|nr:hypothetical protein [Bacteroides sp.]